MYIDHRLKEYIGEVSSNKSVPGGGSVAALVGSLGGALVKMVMGLTEDKELFESLDDNIKDEMFESIKAIEKIIDRFNEIVDEDTKAFNSVLAAYKLPKNTDEEVILRGQKIEEGYIKAFEVPYESMKLSLELLERQKLFLQYGNQGLITDIGIASILACACLESSSLNALINLEGIKDNMFVSEKETDVIDMLNKGKYYKKDILDITYDRI